MSASLYSDQNLLKIMWIITAIIALRIKKFIAPSLVTLSKLRTLHTDCHSVLCQSSSLIWADCWCTSKCFNSLKILHQAIFGCHPFGSECQTYLHFTWKKSNIDYMYSHLILSCIVSSNTGHWWFKQWSFYKVHMTLVTLPKNKTVFFSLYTTQQYHFA